jgi:hypothetical protein
MRIQSTNGFSSQVKSKIDNNKYLISTAKHPSGIWETVIFKVNFLGLSNPFKPLRIKRFDTYEDAEKEHSWCEEAVELLPTDKWDNTADKDIIFTKRDFSSRQDSVDHFIAYEDGTVLDTWTNLMWAARDNGSNINWENAKSYCENYRCGGYTDWRMPTLYELAELLYDADKSYKTKQKNYEVHLTEFIQLSDFCVWASDTFDSEAAAFEFIGGAQYLSNQSFDGHLRALPVRPGK